MAGSEHFMFVEEADFGVWEDPTIALPVRSVSIAPSSPLMIPSETGGGRGRRDGSPGEVAVSGDIETSLYPTVVGRLLAGGFRAITATPTPTIAITTSSAANPSVITTSTPHGLTTGQSVTIAGHSGSTPVINGSHVITRLTATTFSIPVTVTVAGTGGTLTAGTRNKMLPDDDEALLSFSMQKRYRVDTAESIKGAKLNSFTISAATKEFVSLSMNFIAKDATIDSSTWSDGSASPDPIDPVPYPAYFPEAFKFYQGSFLLGGTVTKTANELVVSGGVAKVDFDNIEIECNFNLGTDGYGVNMGDRTVQTIDEGSREVMVRFDPNFDTAPREFYEAWREGEPGVIQLLMQSVNFQTGVVFECIITLPRVRYETGSLPELNADYGLKRYTVEGAALTDPALLNDIGVVIQTTEDYS